MKHVIAETVLKGLPYSDGLNGFSIYERYNDSSNTEVESGDVWIADFRYREHAEDFVAQRPKGVF